MEKFTINYQDAKRILGLLYNSPYQNVVEHVHIMHGLLNEEGKSLKCTLDEEREAFIKNEAAKLNQKIDEIEVPQPNGD